MSGAWRIAILTAAVSRLPLALPAQAPPPDSAAALEQAAEADAEAIDAPTAARYVRPMRPALPRRGRRLEPLGPRRLPDWLAASRARMAGARIEFHEQARQSDVRSEAATDDALSVDPAPFSRVEPDPAPGEVSVETAPAGPAANR